MKESLVPNRELGSILHLQIETIRLILRPVTMEDTADIFREFTPEVTRYMYPRPAKDISETEKFIQTSQEKMAKGEEIVCAILQKESGEFLGCAGLHAIQTATPELGVWLKVSAHGHGYGKEALSALKRWADTHFDYAHINYPVAKNNIPSRKIPESMGGTVAREYQNTNLSGATLEMVEYHIPPSKHV